jgi:nitric oxide synthase oxygenase domain/subunit/sulfite reductase alpha subunit-like flavoprotein
MVWNNQIMDFAGYQMEDGTVLGDPANVELTQSIMELGWIPPQIRGRWDLLPLVTMAEGDKPAMMEIPAPLSTLVDIHHPQYPSFAELGLKWKAAPALTRLGFDIGGVQYTAAPFIGWFMDAEIGVRNLADSFRYNVLPDVIQTLGLTNGKFQNGIDSFEDLPEYEQLAMLSRAQSELNYAVQWSFNQAGVTMTDSLTASKKWCKFDDEFKEKHGYRLPADPYWLAPPQGSIIPIWHRGGAPNYQPKPMISKHVQDPIKAWRREKHRFATSSEPTKLMTFSQTAAAFPLLISMKQPEVIIEEIDDFSGDGTDNLSVTSTITDLKTIAIYFCSTGTIAEKLAKRLHKRVEALTKESLNGALHPRVECLNDLKPADMTADKIFLLVVSSMGKGEVPANGSAFLQVTPSSLNSSSGTSFAVFGNGDSRYSATYNGAAKTIHQHMQKLGGRPLIRKVFNGDIALEPIPYSAVNTWWTSLEPRVNNLISKDAVRDTVLVNYGLKEGTFDETTNAIDEATERLADHAKDLYSFKDASMKKSHPASPNSSQRSLTLSLDIGSKRYEDGNCIQILPLNHQSKVDRALKALNVDATTALGFATQPFNITCAKFLTEFADLELPFKSLDWLFSINGTAASSPGLMEQILRHLSVLETLELLDRTNLLSRLGGNKILLQQILLSMPLLHTRTYSVASSLPPTTSSSNNNTLDIMLKRIPNGRFSSTFLNDHTTLPASLKYRIVDSVSGPRLRHLCSKRSKPLVIVSTGAGFGPVRCLLQERIAAARRDRSAAQQKNVSLILGFHPTDVPLAKRVLDEATELGIIDMLHIVESNAEKRRVQDSLVREDVASRLKDRLEGGESGGWVFVCANEPAARGCRSAFESVMGGRLDNERYLEEVF